MNLTENLLTEHQRKVDEETDPAEKRQLAAYGKNIIFSPFLSALDLVAIGLRKRNIKYYELNGHCSDTDRRTTLNNFEEKGKDFVEDPTATADDTRVLLASLRVGAEGLNLCHAANVIMLTLTYNPYVDEQAFARADRLGQKLQVHIYYLIAENSQEKRIWDIQTYKKAKVFGVMDDKMLISNAKSMQKWDVEKVKRCVSGTYLSN